MSEFVPGTRVNVQCDTCGKRRVRLDNIGRIACDCPSNYWIVTKFLTPYPAVSTGEGKT